MNYPPRITKPARSSNLELYRILLMLLIVFAHYVNNSGLGVIIFNAPESFPAQLLTVCGAWGKAAINGFVLITGYFMCRADISVRKFLKLVLQVLFYSLGIYLIFVFTGYKTFSLTELIKYSIPVRSLRDNFVECFIAFYLFIPFLNILVRNLNKNMHTLLLLLALGLYCGCGSVRLQQIHFNYVTWFCILYFVSSYIRNYGLMPSWNWKRWGVAALFLLLLSSASVIVLTHAGTYPYRLVVDCNAPLALGTAVALFMCFKDMPFPQSRFINTVAACTFGVLLIHAHSDTMRTWLWHDMLNNAGQYGKSSLLWHAFGSVLGVFIICSFIDYLRILLLERPLFRYVDRFLEKRGWN